MSSLVRSLQQQFIKDLRTSWPKTVALILLLMVGLFFWIPPIVRAVFSEANSGAQYIAQEEVSRSLTQTAENSASEPTTVSFRWDTVDELMSRDPLVHSAAVAAISSDPFQIDLDEYSPPVLFEPEPNAAAESPAAVMMAQRAALETGLVLKSTIIGQQRRAALINDRLYLEGTEIVLPSGVKYALREVHPGRVIISVDGQIRELKIWRSLENNRNDGSPATTAQP